jgi:hypothetical protein
VRVVVRLLCVLVLVARKDACSATSSLNGESSDGYGASARAGLRAARANLGHIALDEASVRVERARLVRRVAQLRGRNDALPRGAPRLWVETVAQDTHLSQAVPAGGLNEDAVAVERARA